MDNIEILSAVYELAHNQIPSVLLQLRLSAGGGAVDVKAYIGDIRPLFHENGLVYLHGKSPGDVKKLRQCLPARNIPEYPDEPLECVSDNSRLLNIANHLLDAANFRNGAEFVARKPIPQHFLT